MINKIPPNDVDKLWLSLEKLIYKAIHNRRFTETETMESVKSDLINNNMQLWYCTDGSNDGIILTTISVFPKTKILEVNYAAGSNIENFCLEAYERMKQFGKENGCKQLRGFGRRGWIKLIPDKPKIHLLWDVDI